MSLPVHGAKLARLLSLLLTCGAAMAAQPDPFAANNTVYPPDGDWKHGMRPSNYDYPQVKPDARWLKLKPRGPLTVKTAPAYVAAVKAFITRDMSGLVNDPLNWTPQKAGWYDMPWGGQGSPRPDGTIAPESGREPLLGSYTGQILKPDSYPSNPPGKAFQNHAVVYYNDVAAHQLGKIWADPFHPKLKEAKFPEGSMVVKVEGATLTEDDWPVLKGSSISKIYRPTLVTQKDGSVTPTGPVAVTSMHFLQMAVRVKDSEASPQTGWVFIAFFYDTRANGATPWDRAMPAGATWGSDPELAKHRNGLGPNGQLQETWIADNLPGFVTDGLGWGGRLAGPLDLGIRHNVVTVSGKRYGDGNPKRPDDLPASSCISCHIAAQYPFITNLYPSPNMSFPPEGGQFLMWDPGSPQWRQWFRNIRAPEGLSSPGRGGAVVGTDYDMMLTFALMRANGSADTDAFIRHGMAGH